MTYATDPYFAGFAGTPRVGCEPATTTPDAPLTCHIDVCFQQGGMTLRYAYEGPWSTEVGEQLEAFLLHAGV